MGYAAPEYVQTGRLTSKSDYGSMGYSFMNSSRSEQKLLEWVKPFLSDMKKFHLILDPRLEGKYPLKSAQMLAIVANRGLVRHPKSRPNMSEVLEMVNQIVEASTQIGSPPLPLKSLAQVETSVDTEPKNNKRNVDLRTGESGWFVRMWTRKLLRTC
ncbi:serine/threonine-protein kinase PCRK1-like [Fagus crenata]